MIRDVKRTIDSPAMAVDFMTGLPLHKIHKLRRDQMAESERIRQEEGGTTIEESEEMMKKLK